ncbi:MAG: 5-(carboxyamino)imidazole ribonucleotide synthase [Spirochaetales bacterium]|nr:5-(carboxyamino)imidazole ribonucleotide synthase [Spirochaetales bacterium]
MLYKPGLKLGILGGGQLGRMLIQAAMDLDLEVHILDPDPAAPASPFAHRFVCGSFQDRATVLEFGRGLDLLTIEIEAVDTDALLELASGGLPVFPQPQIIKTIQNKATQKEFYQRNQLACAPWKRIETSDELAELSAFPVVQKTLAGGYDGRGVKILQSRDDLGEALPCPCIIEGKIPIEKEISVLVSGHADGSYAIYDPVELTYHDALFVDALRAPARIPAATRHAARALALQTAQSFGIVGILAVEMFLTLVDGEKQLLINECAPRVHNSGHHTMRACPVSQFEAHLRAITGLPPGRTDLHCPAGMVNITGPQSNRTLDLHSILKAPGNSLHLYGKAPRPGRKIGHVITLAEKEEDLDARIESIRSLLA